MDSEMRKMSNAGLFENPSKTAQEPSIWILRPAAAATAHKELKNLESEKNSSNLLKGLKNIQTTYKVRVKITRPHNRSF